MTRLLAGSAHGKSGENAVPTRGAAPLIVAIAHNKGGVGKTTSTLMLGRYLSRRWRVELRDYDETAHLTNLVEDLAGAASTSITRGLWLKDGKPRQADLVLIDSPPARGRHTRRALVEAHYVLIPAPPERMAIRAMRQMFATIHEIRADRQEGNPFLAILGVVPTLFTANGENTTTSWSRWRRSAPKSVCGYSRRSLDDSPTCTFRCMARITGRLRMRSSWRCISTTTPRQQPPMPKALRGRVRVAAHEGEERRVREQLDEARYGPPLLIPVDQIDPNPRNPRRLFDEEALNELAESIKQWKQLQPIVVRRVGERFELICGERRWRAHRRAGIDAIWAVERDASDADAYALALVENIQRVDLSHAEKVAALDQLGERERPLRA
jgi:cellulose biosynthesis protein BcsQ